MDKRERRRITTNADKVQTRTEDIRKMAEDIMKKKKNDCDPTKSK